MNLNYKLPDLALTIQANAPMHFLHRGVWGIA